MNRNATLLDAKDAAEIDVLTFNFALALASAETIASAAVTCAVHSGTDATPGAMLLQAPQISGRNVLQQIGGGVIGAVYLLRCEALLSSGRKLALGAVLPVMRIAP
ncbi:MAG: phage fiber-tail adaptor protein [Burkholderiaceae bacterium]